MKKSSTLVPLLMCCMLGGCAAPKIVKTDTAQLEVDRQILEVSRKIERMQLQLVQAGALDRPAKAVPVVILDKGQAISISWNGDAFQLLEKIATERGLIFVSTGVRLPLPVAINIHDQPFGAALDAIRAQTAYRADVVQTAAKLVLQFNCQQVEDKS